MKKHILILSALVMISACTTTDYRVYVPETNVKLNTPAAGAEFDLNTEGVYKFGWTAPGSEEYSLLLSESPYLLNPLEIIAGSEGNYSMDFDGFDQVLAMFGMKAGAMGTIYWSAKPTANLTIAASEIRRFSVKRLVSNLLTPVDRERLALSYDEPDKVCLFSWDTDDVDNGDYEVIFSTGPGFEAAHTAAFDATADGKAALTHWQLQGLVGALGIDPFEMNTLYWNVRKKNGSNNVSPASATLMMDGMLILEDPRDGEVYRVTKIQYSDGEEAIWFAENFRGSKYTDGTDLPSDGVLWPNAEQVTASQNGTPVPSDMVDQYLHAYGGHYDFEIRNQIAPPGWHLPGNDEFVKLFNEAARAEGGYVVLKDPVFYSAGIKDTDVNVNAWKMNMNAAGRFLQWGEYVNYNRIHANFHIATLPDGMTGMTDVTLLHDGGSQLWYPQESSHAPVRFVYGNP